jgi:tetratricopeptide (TPR) repeat protein
MDIEKLKKEFEEIKVLFAKKQFLAIEKKTKAFIENFEITNEAIYKIFLDFISILTISLLNLSKIDVAAEILEKCVKDFPFEERLLSKLSEIYLKLKRVNDAEIILSGLINIKPGNIEYHLKLITIFTNNENNLRAIFELKKLVMQNCFDLNILKLLISLLGKEKIFSEQLRYIKIALMLEPDAPFLLIEQARSLAELGQNFEAWEIIDNFVNSGIEAKNIDSLIVSMLFEFSKLYLKLGFRDLLIINYIRLLILEREKPDKELKLKLGQLAKEINLEILFNFFYAGKTRTIVGGKTDENNLHYLTNCLLIIKESAKSSTFLLRNFLDESPEIKKLPKELIMAIYSTIISKEPIGQIYA